MADHHDLPYKAEYAKSGRSSCKACKSNIGQDSLRLAAMVQSPMFDGKIPNWFHFACFWKRNRVENPDDIHGFHSLRWDDQQKIKEKIGAGGGGDAGGGASAAAGDFKTEYAKSGKSTCRGCEEKIAKDEVRISKKDFASQRAKMYGPQDLWYHVDCFIKEREELGFGPELGADKIAGFAQLKAEDKETLTSKLGKGKAPAKRKTEPAKAVEAKKKKEDTEDEKLLREQSELVWKLRDDLMKNVSNEAMRLMLELNGHSVPSGESKLLDAMSDCLAFGTLEKCPECKEGQLVYSSEGYKCTGNVTEWTKCLYITKTPKRKAFKVPKEFHDVEFLKKYKYVKRERAFPKLTVRATDGPVSSSLDAVDGKATLRPLEHVKLAIAGKLSKTKAEIVKTIESLGGTVVTKIDKKVAACISTPEEVKKASKAIKDAEKADVHVVSENFLEEVRKGGAALLIQKCSIASWGSDPSERIEEAPAPSKSGARSGVSAKDEKMFTKSVPAKLKMMVKGGAAVDPDSGLTETAHVIEERDNVYSSVLGLVDIVRGTNSFYKLQALEGDKGSGWWLFRAWGRVGTTIGGNKVERCGSRQSAISKFRELFFEKTLNEWENRGSDVFQKQPNKFYPLEIDYGQEEDTIKTLDLKSSSSKLPKSVQDLICLIFDVESMKKTMLEFEIDMKKMPLGKLSKRQIESAYKVLSELQDLIQKKGTPTQFLDASNRFYTLIPHDFGMKKPPLLDAEAVIKAKTEMLDNLLEIEVAYSMLKGGDEGEDPIDAHYHKLKCKLEPLEDKDMYGRLLDYVKNTHAATHNQYDLQVLDIFTVGREGEAKRYKPFKDLHNRQLLWHGSRTTNFAGILSQGLRIAPPEAPVTGYMFGKGVYFADMVSKSANYCCTSSSNPTGVLLLCEVALGNMHELTSSSYITSLPPGKHSTKGVGMTFPDPSGAYTTPEGVVLPMGPGVPSKTRSSLLYNEYIVYDIAQVEIKYLLKTKFCYKW